MSTSAFRSAVCCLLACLLPVYMLGEETASAMLYTAGSAWLNGSAVPKSAAVYSGDLLQTRSDSTANIQANGSSVMVMADSLVKFEGPAVELEHGGVRVTTSKALAAHAGDVTIKPAGNSWTEFQVVDVDGRVQIAANKGDVTVQDDQGTTTVSQGQQTTRDDTSTTEKKKKRKKSGAAAPGQGGLMSSPWVVYGATGIIVGGGIWVLLQHNPPASPSCPTDPCQ
jgi:ferric-dicitrate binding protein FerR (iron transport regulator)